jgi:hypothetical protein
MVAITLVEFFAILCGKMKNNMRIKQIKIV